MTTVAEFKGPIFIVGMPRSGTKLLRDVMNNHSKIGITANESGILPHFHKTFHEYEDIKDLGNFKEFYRDFSNTTFFLRLTKNDPFIDESTWYARIKDWSYAGVIEAFYTHYAETKGKSIWGDKTPSYMLNIPMFKEMYPNAKFIHIIRDVRDYSLSINKAWNKNMLRASQRWNDSIVRSRGEAKKYAGEDYLEVRFEDVVDNPDSVLKEICSFLGIDFEEGMTTLKKASENIGDAKGATSIVKNNHGKWKQRMDKKSIKRIEQICTPLLSELGYSVSTNGEAVHLTKGQMKRYKILDAANLLWWEIKTNGLKQGVSTFIKSIKRERIV